MSESSEQATISKSRCVQLVDDVAEAHARLLHLRGIPGPFDRQSVGSVQAIGHVVRLRIEIGHLKGQHQVVGPGIDVVRRVSVDLHQLVGLGELELILGHDATEDDLGDRTVRLVLVALLAIDLPVHVAEFDARQLLRQLLLHLRIGIFVGAKLVAVNLLERGQERRRAVVVQRDGVGAPAGDPNRARLFPLGANHFQRPANQC